MSNPSGLIEECHLQDKSQGFFYINKMVLMKICSIVAYGRNHGAD